MKFSQDLSERIQKTIDEFVNESGENIEIRRIAGQINFLPVMFDWGGCWGLTPNGETILFVYDEPHKTKVEINQKIVNIVLFRIAEKYPRLKELMPVRNAESVVCPGCDGTGIIKEFADNELLSKSVACNCGGVGWLPSADKKYLYF